MGRTSRAKEQLLEAALDLIWERSYGVVTIDAICEKAGVKKGSFYYYFESKSALAVAALEADWTGRGRPKWDATFSATVAPLERIRNFFQGLYESQVRVKQEHGQVLGCPCFSVGSETSTQDEPIRAKVQQILQAQIRYFESAVRDAQAAGLLPAGDAGTRARCLFALFEGSLAQARINNDAELLRPLSEAALEMLGVKGSAPVG